MFEVSTASFHTKVDEHRLQLREQSSPSTSWYLQASVSVGREDCISFQTRPKWMLNLCWNPVARTCSRLQICFAIWLRLSTGQHACTHGKAGSRLDCYQLQWIHWLRWMASELAWRQPSGLPCRGSYAWTLQVISTQAGEYWWTQESSAVDMGPATTVVDQQSHIELPEKTLGLCESWWWTLQTYAKMNYLSDFGICNNSQCFLTMKITSCCWLFRAKFKIWHRIFI